MTPLTMTGCTRCSPEKTTFTKLVRSANGKDTQTFPTSILSHAMDCTAAQESSFPRIGTRLASATSLQISAVQSSSTLKRRPRYPVSMDTSIGWTQGSWEMLQTMRPMLATILNLILLSTIHLKIRQQSTQN